MKRGKGGAMVRQRVSIFIAIVFFGITFSTCLRVEAAGVFIPAPGRMDMVYDEARKLLYITSGSAVLRYCPASGAFIDGFELNGKPTGIDLSPDGNTLAVADQSRPGIHLIDLNTNRVTQALFTPQTYEVGSYSVAYGADGAVLITSTLSGSGWVPLRRYEPATNSMTQIATVRQNSMVSASADRSVIGYVESNISSGPVGIYDVASRSIKYTQTTSWFNYEIGANRNGTQFAVPTYGGTYIFDSLLNRVATIGTYAGQQPIGVVYHPLKDIVYFPWAGTGEIRAMDTTTFATLGAYDLGYTFTNPGNSAFNQGRLRISRDGSLLFATVEGGVRYLSLLDKPVAEQQSVSLDEDTSVAIVLTGTSGDPAQLSFTITTPPRHGSLAGTLPNLVYTPATDYAGSDQFSFFVSNGNQNSDPALVDILVRPVNDPPRAVNDSATTTKGTAVTIAVLANDSDVDGDLLAITSVTSGHAGTTAITGGKTVTYTPSRNFTGTDSFTYAITDGKGGTATATVTVTVMNEKKK
jgi:hypothetical protein